MLQMKRNFEIGSNCSQCCDGAAEKYEKADNV
jgi:hypothetical protein